MRSCARIYTIIQEPPTLWVPEKLVDQELKVVNVLPMYMQGIPRTDNYDRVAKTIVESVKETNPIAYVTYATL
jgi:hypothetical protein